MRCNSLRPHLFHCDYYDSKNAFPLFLFNFITYCLTLVVLFKFAKLLLKDAFLALMSVLAYSALTNSYAYLRHTFPYDQSLLILYYVLYVISKNTAANIYTFRSSFFIGFLSFFGYLVYPGYIPLYLTGLFLLFFTNLSGATFLKNFSRSFYYGAGSICCLILFEAMARNWWHLLYR